MNSVIYLKITPVDRTMHISLKLVATQDLVSVQYKKPKLNVLCKLL